MSEAKTKVLTEQMLADMQPNAMVFRGLTKDIDQCLQPGIWMTNASTVCANPPSMVGTYWQYAILEVMKRDSLIFQRMTCYNKGCVYRMINSSGIGDWIPMGPIATA